MDYFYDGQMRRYILQIVRFFSNFLVKYGDGTLVRVPVMYGDADRQAASIIRQNSENKINSAPRIAIYISGLELDTSRLSDSTYVGKVHVRERDTFFDPDTGRETYGFVQGGNYTVERIMPTPYKLTIKADLWTTSTDQKLQLMEQILVLFNPSIELQTTDNYIDWTSLSVLNLDQVNFSSRQVPVGNDSPIDIATLTLVTPIWLSPPVKVKQLGIITNIVSNVFNGIPNGTGNYIDGLGSDPFIDGVPDLGANSSGVRGAEAANLMLRAHATVANFGVQVYNGVAKLLDKHEAVIPNNSVIAIAEKLGPAINWRTILDQYPGQYRAGFSQLRLKQESGNEVIGTISLNPLDESLMNVNWDSDTYPTNTPIVTGHRTNSPGTFDAIIDPLTKGPRGSGLSNPVDGTRYLIIESIGNADNVDGADAWKGNDNSDLVALENDIIEWNGTKWVVIFAAAQNSDSLIYQTNIYTGVQYKWTGIAWVKSFEGEYRAGSWILEL
jgi:hypothetical protein